MAVLRIVAVALVTRALATAQDDQFGSIGMSPAGLVPRFFLNANAPQLVARDDPHCRPGAHRCNDIGEPHVCCPNDQYCYVNPSGEAQCCAVGSNCDSNCDATAYQCDTVVSTSGTSSTSSACCGRTCPSTSQFQCEEEYGGGCCGYGSTCVSGGSCRSTLSSESPVVTAIDPGCTSTDQHACPDDEGCCNNWMHCTSSGGTAVCAPGNTDRGYTFVPGDDQDEDDEDENDDGGGGGGLSVGARAGIGVGAAVAVSGIVGVVAWLCLVKRRRHRNGGGVYGTASNLSPEQQQQQQQRQQQQQQQQGRSISDRSPQVQDMSDVGTGEVSRTTRLGGLTQDYFGPDAVAGPYTEDASSPGAAAAASPGGPDRGVPLTAQSPNDIAAPVEIDSRMSPTGPASAGGVPMTPATDMDSSVVPTPPLQPPPAGDASEARFELYGSDIQSPGEREDRTGGGNRGSGA